MSFEPSAFCLDNGPSGSDEPSRERLFANTADRKLRVLLVGNYENDRQESMQRFATMLLEGLRARGIPTELVSPKPFFGRLKRSGNGVGKWLGYLDKFVLFPFTLHRKSRPRDESESVLVHVCDHSNAPYLPHAASVPSVVTCHDLGAIRGALGEPTYCPASTTGKILQRWILKSLARAGRIVCDSTATMTDVQRLLGPEAPKSHVVLLGLNQQLALRGKVEAESTLANALPHLGLTRPYLLHVGSSHPRKNRDGILRIFHRIRSQWDGQLVFAGERLSPSLEILARDLGLSERIVVVEKPESRVLEALYNRAWALLFPSRFEGFGWPVVEAQACGCPVICSDASSLPEVAGNGALIRNVEEEDGFGHDVLSLCDPAARAGLIQRGFENVARFNTERMIDHYLRIYREVIAPA